MEQIYKRILQVSLAAVVVAATNIGGAAQLLSPGQATPDGNYVCGASQQTAHVCKINMMGASLSSSPYALIYLDGVANQRVDMVGNWGFARTCMKAREYVLRLNCQLNEKETYCPIDRNF
jgi:hypothetical protein